MPQDRGRLSFGTSVFHAYVHNWTCQLEYNPRFNVGWGLSDGEGLERMWLYLALLVSPLRYATRNHRLGALAQRLKYHNQRGIKKLRKSAWFRAPFPGQWMWIIMFFFSAFWLRRKFNNAVVRHLDTSAILLGLLELPNPFSSSGQNYTEAYFKKQWKLQRKFKSQHSTSDEKEKKDLVALYKKEAALERLR
jgi:hypothetical protein